MDLTSRVKSFRSRQGQALSWILSTGRRPKVVVAMGDRLSLLLIGQILTSPESLLAAVTTEREAIASTPFRSRMHEIALQRSQKTS
jgi:hypothetical protein